MPITSFPELLYPESTMPLVDIGDDVAEDLGITHWDDFQDDEPAQPKKFRRPKNLRGWLNYFYYLIRRKFLPDPRKSGENMPAPETHVPEYDVARYQNFVGAFTAEDQVVVTEKIHGANGRFIFDGKRMYAGSRKLWKSEKSSNVWRRALNDNPWIELWCRAHPNYAIFAEIVPTQGGFDYGYAGRGIGAFVFDIRTPGGRWMDYIEAKYMTGNQFQWVPELYRGKFDEEKIKALAEGKSTVKGGDHVREGVVIGLLVEPPAERQVHGLGRLKLKIVGNDYYEETKNTEQTWTTGRF